MKDKFKAKGSVLTLYEIEDDLLDIRPFGHGVGGQGWVVF